MIRVIEKKRITPKLANAGMRVVESERGIALAMVLIVSAIALAIMAGLVYMLISGTQISGMQKRYRTAQEAGLGGADITYQLIAARGNPNIGLTGFALPALNVSGVNCLTEKLNTATNNPDGTLRWNVLCSNTTNIDPSVASSYDMTFQLGAYTVFSKIVDTIEGNSGGDEGLLKGGVVSSSGEITVVSRPYLYTIEVNTENMNNRAERSKYSILYQY